MIPQIIGLLSADHAFPCLDELTLEGIGWKRVADNCTAVFFRVWLKERIQTWPRLTQIYSRMWLDDDITCDAGKRDVIKLVNIDW